MKHYLSVLLFFTLTANAQYQYQAENIVPMYSFLYGEQLEKLEKAFFEDAAFPPEGLNTDIAMYQDYRSRQNTTTEKDGTITVTTELSYGHTAKTTFKEKIIDGKKLIYNQYDNLVQEIPYSNGQLNGVAKTFGSYGNVISETAYKNGKKNGLKKVKYQDAKRHYDDNTYYIEGNYVNGKLQGRLTITTDRITILYPSDFKRGKVEVYFDKTDLWIAYGIAEKNLKHGTYTQYEINPKTLKPQKTVVADFYMGEYHGWVEKHTAEGHFLFKNKYHYGKPVGEHKFYNEKGQLSAEACYDEQGKPVGIWRSFDNNGKLLSALHYDSGHQRYFKEEYKNGFLQKKEQYINGKLDGKAQYFDTTGRVTSEAFYDNGAFIKEIAYFKSGRIKYDYTLYREKSYYDKEGNKIWTNTYTDSRQTGEHKAIFYDTADNYKVYSTEEYDSMGRKIFTTGFTGANSYIKVPWRNNQRHGIGKEVDENGKEKPIYYFEGNMVSEEEYMKLVE